MALHGGYKVLDVRSDRERALGYIRGSGHVPFTKDRRTIDNKFVASKVDAWIYKVRARIPKKGVKMIVHDSNGKYAVECLEKLFADGYENIVGLKGGFESLKESEKWAEYIGKDVVVSATKSLLS